MTRKQAFLILLIALLMMAGRQHIQWPSRFWESPSFEAINGDDIAKMLSRQKPAAQEQEAPLLIEEKPTAPEIEPEPKKEAPATPAPKPERKKSTKKSAHDQKPTAVYKQDLSPAPSFSTSSTPQPTQVPFRFYDERVKERIGACWEFADTQSKDGVIRIQFTHDQDGYLQGIRTTVDTLKIPLMERCVPSSIEGMRFVNAHANAADTTVFETTITFRPSKEPS